MFQAISTNLVMTSDARQPSSESTCQIAEQKADYTRFVSLRNASRLFQNAAGLLARSTIWYTLSNRQVLATKQPTTRNARCPINARQTLAAFRALQSRGNVVHR